jgi:Fe-S-cluster-containing hydrogenase component 2
MYNHREFESKIHVKKQSKSRFIPTCHQCGLVGYI